METPSFELWDDAPASKPSSSYRRMLDGTDAELGRDLLSFGVPVWGGDPEQLPPSGGASSTMQGRRHATEVHRQAADDPDHPSRHGRCAEDRRLEPGTLWRQSGAKASDLSPTGCSRRPGAGSARKPPAASIMRGCAKR